MKVVYFNYIIDAIGPLIRTLEIAKATSENGVEVIVVFMENNFNPPPFVHEKIKQYESDKLHFIAPNSNYTNEQVAPSSREPQKAAVPASPKMSEIGALKHILRSLQYVKSELQIVKEYKPNAIIARADHSLSFCVTARLARLPLVLDTDGPVEELAIYWGLSAKWVVKFDYVRARLSDSIVVISNVCQRLLLDKFPRTKTNFGDRFFLAPNGTTPEEFAPLNHNQSLTLRESLGLTACRVIGYSGNQRSWHGLPKLLKAILPILTADPKVKLLIIGCGVDETLATTCGVPREIFNAQVVFTGRLSYTDMANHISLADVMVMPYDKLPLFYFSPMRMFEAMSVGKPLIASRQGQMEDILNEKASVRFFDLDDNSSLEHVVNEAIYDDEFIKSGIKNLNYLKAEHTWFARGTVFKEAIAYAIAQRVE